MELRYNTEQIVRVGVFIEDLEYIGQPLYPVYGVNLTWYSWHYAVKADGTIVELCNHTWENIPNCSGCYYLTLTASDTDQLGPLILYFYDVSLKDPIFMEFSVINPNVWDSKYGDNLMSVDFAQKG